MRPEATKVLSYRGLQAPDRCQHDAGDNQAPPGVARDEQADDKQHNPREHRKLGQRKRIPGRCRALLYLLLGGPAGDISALAQTRPARLRICISLPRRCLLS